MQCSPGHASSRRSGLCKVRAFGRTLHGTQGAEAIHVRAKSAERVGRNVTPPPLKLDPRFASDRIADMVAEGINVAIRLGWSRDSTLRAVKLGEFEQLLVASSEYLARHGAPKRPEDLVAHDWIAFTRLPAPLTWKFVSKRGRAATVRMAARVRTDSSATLRSLVLSGAGVSAINRLSIEEELRSGRLERLLPECSLPRGESSPSIRQDGTCPRAHERSSTSTGRGSARSSCEQGRRALVAP